ncbi:hypothetical protein AAY473_026345 [Plecturocebus cupreus]
MGFHHVGQVGLELLASNDSPTLASQSDPPTLASQLAGTTGFRSFRLGWRGMARSQLTATSASYVQAILLSQPPEGSSKRV